MNFCSDNVAGASPEVFQALSDANRGTAMPYGDDPLTERAIGRLRELFETDAEVFFSRDGFFGECVGACGDDTTLWFRLLPFGKPCQC